jgi:hypothetical protein
MGLYTNLGFKKYKKSLKKENKISEKSISNQEQKDEIENKRNKENGEDKKKKSYFENVLKKKNDSVDYRKRFKVGNIVAVYKKNGQLFLAKARVKQIPKKDLMYVVDLNGPIHDYGDHKAYMVTDKKFDVKKL